MKKIILATFNKGKIREIKEILKNTPFEIISLLDLPYKIEFEETGKTFEENAVIKAKTIGEKTGLLTLGEDSGLEVDALGGRPGIYSARYASGSDQDRNNKLLRELKGIPKEKRTARYKAAVVLYNPIDKSAKIFMGVSEGYITVRPRGKNGFGYDPVFFNNDLGKTNGEATQEGKNQTSHRGKALRNIISLLHSTSTNSN